MGSILKGAVHKKPKVPGVGGYTGGSAGVVANGFGVIICSQN